MKPLTYYIDTPSVRVFQTFAGDTLEKLDQFEVWDIITLLCQAVALANLNDWTTIDPAAANALLPEVELSDDATECVQALKGFPTIQVNQLMAAILQVAFDVDQLETSEPEHQGEAILDGLNRMFG